MTEQNSDSSVAHLLDLMRQLRDPETGCEWDLQQNFDTIAPYTIEEAFEVVQAIAERDYPEFCEELGDLLLQVIFHSQMASEQGLFNFADVVEVLTGKLVRRHPHVFGDQQGADLDQIKKTWELTKAAELESKGKQQSSALDGVPDGMPALQQAFKLQKKASKVGFDWNAIGPVVDQLKSEITELEQAMTEQDAVAIEDELGDVLFSVVNLSRHLKQDADLALRRASNKFSQRFKAVEAMAAARGQQLAELEEQALDDLWRKAKVNLADQR